MEFFMEDLKKKLLAEGIEPGSLNGTQNEI